jgi:serine/threonine-protein kinase
MMSDEAKTSLYVPPGEPSPIKEGGKDGAEPSPTEKGANDGGRHSTPAGSHGSHTAELSRASIGPSTEELLAILIAEQQRRWEAGERVPVETYFQIHPVLQQDPEQAIELIYGEFLLREKLGEAPPIDEYCQRFPQYAARLQQQFDLHRAFSDEAPHSETLAIAPASDQTRPAVGPPFQLPADKKGPRYQVLRRLGRGGMGVVYEAIQTSVRRTVALKMVLAGTEADTQERARFRVEAEAIGRLQHPNIVQIYEVGETGGRPFLSMEFVGGGSLAQKLDGTPLPEAEAAQLIETLALAINQAHQSQIIHRDLKPSNVLLTADGTPKITDFGLAKLLMGDDQSLTPTDAIVGTPSYMAPEQAGARQTEIGPAADVYALGAILYECLTGRPPFRGVTAAETIHQVLFDDPVPPSRVRPKVSRDLETICLKCLHKRPAARYPCAKALAEDLCRFRNGEPIVARPLSRLGRTIRWARRRPAAAALLIVATMAILTITVGGWWTSVALTTYSKRVAREKQQAEASFKQTLSALDQLGGTAEVLSDLPQAQEERRQLLQNALGFYQQLIQEHGDEPVVRRETGRISARLGDLEALLGHLVPAEEHYRRAAELIRQLGEESPNAPEPRHELAQTYTHLGILLKNRGKPGEAEAAFHVAQEQGEKLAGDYPQEPEYRRDLASAHYHLGALLGRLDGRRDEAEQACQRARELQTRLADEYPDRPEFRRDLARTINQLGSLRMTARDPHEAGTLFREAIRLQRDLAAHFPGVSVYRRELGRSQNNLAATLAEEHLYLDAADAYQSAIKLFDDLGRAFPDVPDYRSEQAGVLQNLGLLFAERKPAEAETAYRQAVTIREKLAAGYPDRPEYKHRLARVLLNLGILLATARPREAEQIYARAAVVQEEIVQLHPNEHAYRAYLGSILDQWAVLLVASVRLNRADAAAQSLVAAATAQRWSQLTWLACCQAGLLEARSKLQQARDHHRIALEADPGDRNYRRFLHKDYVDLAETLLQLGDHAGAAAAAEAISPLAPDDYRENIRAAQLLVNCLRTVPKTGVTGAELRELTDRYGAAAVRQLRQAAFKGMKNTADLDTPHFAPLRTREDFRQLRRELQSGGAHEVALSGSSYPSASILLANGGVTLRRRPTGAGAYCDFDDVCLNMQFM